MVSSENVPLEHEGTSLVDPSGAVADTTEVPKLGYSQESVPILHGNVANKDIKKCEGCEGSIVSSLATSLSRGPAPLVNDTTEDDWIEGDGLDELTIDQPDWGGFIARGKGSKPSDSIKVVKPRPKPKRTGANDASDGA